MNIIKEFLKKDILTRTILLSWLRSNTDLYEENLELKFEKILKEFIEPIILKALQKQKKDILRGIEKMERCNHSLSLSGICDECSMSDYDEIKRDRALNQALSDIKEFINDTKR